MGSQDYLSSLRVHATLVDTKVPGCACSQEISGRNHAVDLNAGVNCITVFVQVKAVFSDFMGHLSRLIYKRSLVVLSRSQSRSALRLDYWKQQAASDGTEGRKHRTVQAMIDQPPWRHKGLRLPRGPAATESSIDLAEDIERDT